MCKFICFQTCFFLLFGFCFVGLGFASQNKVLEAETIILKSPDGKPALILDASTGVPKVTFLSDDKQPQMELVGGTAPKLSINAKDGAESINLKLSDQGETMLSFEDKQGLQKFLIKGGESPAVFMKNGQGEITATLLTMPDGGTALGLADKDGDVSAFLKGGSAPSISFFQKSTNPMAALGISKSIPHLVVSSSQTEDNLILHGGKPTSLLFVDKQGEIPVLLSKHGLFQGKKQENESEEKVNDKLFTWKELSDPLQNLQLFKR